MALLTNIHTTLDTRVTELIDDYIAEINLQQGVLSEVTISIFYENTLNNTPGIAFFIETGLIPVKPQVLTVGITGEEKHEGIYQVTINTKKDIGYADAYSLGEYLSSKLRRETLLLDTEQTKRVKIGLAYVMPGYIENELYKVPVSIEYYSYLNGD